MITADHVALAVYTAAKIMGLSTEEKLAVLQRTQSIPASRVRMYAARALRRIEPTVTGSSLMRLLGHPAHGKRQMDKRGHPAGRATSFMSMVYIAHQKPWWSGATFEAVVAALDGRSVPVIEVAGYYLCTEGPTPEEWHIAPIAPTEAVGVPSADPIPTQPPAVEPQQAATPAPYKPRPKLLKAHKRAAHVLPSGLTTKGAASFGGINEPASHKSGLQRMLEEAMINTAKQQAAQRDDD